jgi:branched-chain amino acid transport system substrate-binding protein
MLTLRSEKTAFALIVALMALFLAGALLSCGEAQKPAQTAKETQAPVAKALEPIRIGVAGPHSGDLASYGIPTVKAAELVVENRNALGGICGRKIELIVEDDVCKPEIATNTATKLVTDKVDVVLGHICSGATKAALGIYKESKIVAISPSATNPALTQSGDYPNFFRTIASDDAQAKLEVDFALNRLKVSKIAVLHDKGDYGKGLAEFAKGFIEKDPRGEVVLYEGITPGAVDYSAVSSKN